MHESRKQLTEDSRLAADARNNATTRPTRAGHSNGRRAAQLTRQQLPEEDRKETGKERHERREHGEAADSDKENNQQQPRCNNITRTQPSSRSRHPTAVLRTSRAASSGRSARRKQPEWEEEESSSHDMEASSDELEMAEDEQDDEGTENGDVEEGTAALATSPRRRASRIDQTGRVGQHGSVRQQVPAKNGRSRLRKLADSDSGDEY